MILGCDLLQQTNRTEGKKSKENWVDSLGSVSTYLSYSKKARSDITHKIHESRHEGFTDEIKCRLLFGLVSRNRPTYEMLNPHLQDQRTAFERQFEGMSTEAFSYDDYETTRQQLIEIINACLNDNDKAFLLSEHNRR